jgi:plastocyanin
MALTQKPGFPFIDELIPAGGKSEAEDEDAGTHHYQCCIHPWMRMDVTVR